MELSVKQWKALVAAYPVYGSPHSTTAEEGDGATPPNFSDFVDTAVPRVEAAFHSVLASFPAERVKGVRQPPWRNTLPHGVDALLSFLFGSEQPDATQASRASAPTADHYFRKEAPLPLRPLHYSELQLVYLCHKERTRTERVALELATFKEQVQRASLSLVEAAATATAAAETAARPSSALTGNGNEAFRTPVRQQLPSSASFCRTPPTRGSARSLPSPPGPAGASTAPPAPRPGAHEGEQCVNGEDGGAFVSALAAVPYHSAEASPIAGATGVSYAMDINVVCEECGEVGGELFRCRRCGSVRHEACGGPHPISFRTTTTTTTTHSGSGRGTEGEGFNGNGRRASDAEKENLEGLCKCCRKDINLFSSSSSSMHSSTSSEERREIDAYFAKGSDASSMSDNSSSSDDSSFIVHTSDDSDFSRESGDDEDNDEEGDQEEEAVSGEEASLPSASSSSIAHGRDSAGAKRRVTENPRKQKIAGRAKSTSASSAATHAQIQRKRKRTGSDSRKNSSAGSGSDDEDDDLVALGLKPKRTGKSSVGARRASLPQKEASAKRKTPHLSRQLDRTPSLSSASSSASSVAPPTSARKKATAAPSSVTPSTTTARSIPSQKGQAKRRRRMDASSSSSSSSSTSGTE